MNNKHPKTRASLSSPKKSYQRFQTLISQLDTIKLFYLSVGLLVLSLLTLSGALIVQHNYPHALSAAARVEGYALNTPISMGLVTMEITKVSYSAGQPGFAAPADKHYAIVDFKVKNNADHPINVLPSSDIYIKDTAGNVSYLTPFALERPFKAGAVLPGEQAQGQLSYVATKTGELKLYVDGIWSGGVVPFKVQ